MKVLYRRGYDPEETLWVDSIKADRTLGGPAWMVLTDVDGIEYEATSFFWYPLLECVVATLPENW